MKTTERSARKPSSKTGLRVTLRALLAVRGRGALSYRSGAALAGIVTALLVATALTAAPASAAPTPIHKFLYRLQGGETPAGGFTSTGIAVDNSAGPSAGKLYIGDRDHDVVDKYSPSTASATYLCQITGKGEGNPSPPGSECDTSAAGPGAFAGTSGIAVDPSTGLVYVLDPSAHRVDQFTQAGLYAGKQLNLGAVSASRLAVSAATGDVFVADETNKRITEWEPSTATVTTFSTGADTPTGSFGSVKGVAVDNDPSSPSYKDVYVVDGENNVVDRLSESGAYQCQITGAGESSTSATECSKAEPGVSAAGFTALTGALAVDPTSGHLYAGDGFTGPIDEFATSGDYLASILGSETSHGFWSPANVAISASSGDVFIASNLNPDEAYVFGPDAPVVHTVPATAVTPTSAILRGTVNPVGIEVTNCHFEYVEVAQWEPSAANPYSHGQTAPCVETVGSGIHPVSVHANVTLQAGKLYHYRLLAENTKATGEGEDEFFGPPFIDTKAVTEITHTTATLGAAVNPDSVDTHYHFEYGEPGGAAGVYNHSAPASPAGIGSGNAEVSVSQAISGLQPEATYHFRVVATNASGTTDGPDRSLSTLPALLIDAQPAASIGTTEATLQAYIDPLGTHTTYHFEYGTEETYGHSIPTADAGEGSAPVLRSAHITELQPNTTYHFRAVATNALGPVAGPDSTFTTEPASCPNEQFRTGPSAQLPECRAFEQVSPEQKGAAPALDAGLGTATGDRIFYYGLGSFAGNTFPGASAAAAQYLAQRGPSGWTTEAIHPSEAQTAGAHWGGLDVTLSPDLTESLWEGEFANNFNRAQAGALFLRSLDGSVRQASPTFESLNPGVIWGETIRSFEGESADLSHAILHTHVRMIPSDTLPTTFNVDRLYDVTTGLIPTISLVELDNEGHPMPTCGAAPELGAGSSSNNSKFNAISHDGSAIFFSIESPGHCAPVFGASNAQLYVRLDQSETVPVSEPDSNLDCETSGCRAAPPSGAAFAGASEDGSKAFFLSTRRLTDQASEDPVPTDSAAAGQWHCSDAAHLTGPNRCNLYMYGFGRPAGHRLLDLSAGDPSGTGPRVQGIVRSSADGSRVYFVAQGLLTGQPNSLGQTAKAGAENLYLYDTTTEKVSFLAELCSGEGKSGTLTAQSQCFGDDMFSLVRESQSFASPDGGVFIFQTNAQLTPDDQNESTDVYRYDARTGSLARVSVGHDGQGANGNGGGGGAELIPVQSALTTGTANGRPEYQAALDKRPMSDDGQTIVFATARALQNGDENEKVDFYEWHQGQVTLVSGGKSTRNLTRFSKAGNSLGGDPTVSPSGHDIVFSTDSELVQGDSDGLADVYDVRIGGGFPTQNPPPICESAEACHGGPPAEPTPPTLGTETFRGPGNTEEKPCKKGFVKKNGKCVKKHHKHKHRKHRKRAANTNHGGAK